MTIQEARLATARELRDFSDAPDIDVDRILLHLLGEHESSYLTLFSTQVLTLSQKEHLDRMVSERMTGKPLAYILGEVEFYGHSFHVTPDVLIPRPETEEIILIAMRAVPVIQASKGRPIMIADIGTGSGCIAITLALEIPSLAHLIATDISPKALEIAKHNAQRYGLAEKISFEQGSLLDPLAGKTVDLIVSNPPYVPSTELLNLGDPTRIGLRFEPHQALDGGPDGLEYVRILQQSPIPAIIETVGGRVITSKLPL
jgi:release factor glutamine methyltransferase